MFARSTLLFAILLVAGCDDPLPPYERPNVVITTTISTSPLDSVSYAESFEMVNSDSALVLFQLPTPAKIMFYAENLFYETLYGKTAVTGKVELWVIDQPSLRTTIPITDDDLMPTLAYDSKTGYLTVDPEIPLWFQVPWDLREDNGRRIYHDLPYSILNEKVRVNGVVYERSFYRVFSPKMHIRVSLQLFPQTSTFSADQDFSLTIMRGIVITQP
jgi:hypothetical protein